MKTIITGAFSLTLIAALTFTSCKKKEEAGPDNEQATAMDNHLAQNSSNDITTMGGNLAESNSNNYSNGYRTDNTSLASCGAITANQWPNPTSFTVDFGSGITCLDGRTRSGKLFFDFSQSAPGATHYRNPGFKMIVTSQNYVVDGNQINITNKTITNITPTPITGNLKWNIVSSLNIVKSGGGNVTWACNRTHELLNSNDTTVYKNQATPIVWSKATVQVNGTASGTNAKGENFTTVATNLVKSMQCSPDPSRPRRHPFISGTLAYTPGSRHTRTIDFGNGTCDFDATITVNGHTYNITLP
ncbi:MAG: hypothetical protein JSU07_10760 [Bacteroidetes bacterium]|nr:hypothetical protein [Bacteroidota bacterium]